MAALNQERDADVSESGGARSEDRGEQENEEFSGKMGHAGGVCRRSPSRERPQAKSLTFDFVAGLHAYDHGGPSWCVLSKDYFVADNLFCFVVSFFFFLLCDMTLSPKLVHKNEKQAQLDTWPRSNQSSMGRPLTRPHAHTHTNITNIPPGEKRASPREERKKNQMIIIMYKRKTEEEERERERERERELVCVKEREMSIQGKVF